MLSLETKKNIAGQFAESIAAQQNLPLPDGAKKVFVDAVTNEGETTRERAIDSIKDKFISEYATSTLGTIIPGLAQIEKDVREGLTDSNIHKLKLVALNNNLDVSLPEVSEDNSSSGNIQNNTNKTDIIKNTNSSETSPSIVTYSESVEIKCDTAPLELARSYLGTKEGTKTADVFVKTFGSGNSKSTPWCAGFVSYCLKKTGHDFTKNPLRAKSYIGKMGPGHIAFWDKNAGKMIAGNYGNKVAYQKLPKIYKWNTPEEIDKGNYTGFEATTPEGIPNGAIIIMNRSSSNNDMI